MFYSRKHDYDKFSLPKMLVHLPQYLEKTFTKFCNLHTFFFGNIAFSNACFHCSLHFILIILQW